MEEEGAAGDAIRRELGQMLAETKHREFYTLGVVLGSRYRQSPVLSGETSAVGDAPDSTDYTPLARAGCLAPHAWLNDNKDDRSSGASLYDHFESCGFTLLVTRKDAAAAANAVVDAASEQGIPLKVLAPGFYAKQDIRTPVKVAIVVLVLTQLLNLLFVPQLGHAGLALSIGCGALVNALWLLIGLHRRG
eukprot:gene15525-18979_t